ncbi:hypothetical protein P691DRAFT_780201 [Macrolepiota fuliginosa MF-IS2]|uniref:Uncharacterized protein n=1 Tax=Macrolepiota fuliginosa MF-IS2 TaxID=1400762 RepID=A0A9P6BUE0_9AGAR|nr:hypothetical protein P691DRAFT_780201 [Macrolepiota fuliginosa MF-IS2]
MTQIIAVLYLNFVTLSLQREGFPLPSIHSMPKGDNEIRSQRVVMSYSARMICYWGTGGASDAILEGARKSINATNIIEQILVALEQLYFFRPIITVHIRSPSVSTGTSPHSPPNRTFSLPPPEPTFSDEYDQLFVYQVDFSRGSASAAPINVPSKV